MIKLNNLINIDESEVVLFQVNQGLLFQPASEFLPMIDDVGFLNSSEISFD